MFTILARVAAPLALAIVWTGPTASQSVDDLGPLIGTWRVTGVAVASSPVQAHAVDDPSLMGSLLEVTRDRVSWRAPHRATSLDTSCEKPRIVRGAILCRGGSFGPPGTRATRRGTTLTLPWYDGATLRLTRAPIRKDAPVLTAEGYGPVSIGGSSRVAGTSSGAPRVPATACGSRSTRSAALPPVMPESSLR